jgi:hypothetical protein
MRRTRIILLGLLVVLTTLASRGQVSAAVPTCSQLCSQQYARCEAACKGNTLCENSCASWFAGCMEGCEG